MDCLEALTLCYHCTRSTLHQFCRGCSARTDLQRTAGLIVAAESVAAMDCTPEEYTAISRLLPASHICRAGRTVRNLLVEYTLRHPSC